MRLITCLFGVAMLAACASSTPRDTTNDMAKRAQSERELERACHFEQTDPRLLSRCHPQQQRPSRNPEPLKLPVELPDRLL